MGIADFGHPFGTRKMALVHRPGAGGFGVDVNAEDQRGDLLPGRPFSVSVEEPQVVSEVPFIVRRELWRLGRAVLKLACGHSAPNESPLTILDEIHPAVMRNSCIVHCTCGTDGRAYEANTTYMG